MTVDGIKLGLHRLGQRIWVRLATMSLGAAVFVVGAGFIDQLVGVPAIWDIGQESVATILQILATSMLAVTTFSLTALLTAYGSAATTGTPRATQLLVADPSAQQALATFLASFVYAMLGIVALSTGNYEGIGKTLLYLGALAVIALIVVTLLTWINRLTRFGRMSDVLDRVERASSKAVTEYAHRPLLGGVEAVPVPSSVPSVEATKPGVIVAIDAAALGAWSRDQDADVHVLRLPGDLIARGDPLAASDAIDDDNADRLRSAFWIEPHRTFDQDPRLGIVALSEIASRALSPAVNDPGTAIEALNALQRVYTTLLTTEADDDAPYPRLHVPRVSIDNFLEDGLRPLERDGAPLLEVTLRLLHVVRGLVRIADAEGRRALVRRARHAVDLAVAATGDVQAHALLRDALAEVEALAAT